MGAKWSVIFTMVGGSVLGFDIDETKKNYIASRDFKTERVMNFVSDGTETFIIPSKVVSFMFTKHS